MPHPLEVPSPAVRRGLTLLSLAATLVLAVALTRLTAPFSQKQDQDGARYDIVAFELAHTPARAQQILDTWGPDGVAAARRQTLLDYAFLLAYANLGALLVLWAAARYAVNGIPLLNTGRGLAWGQWLAGLLDAVENTALLHILDSGAHAPYPQLAAYCAALKFGLVGLGLIYVLPALAAPLMRRRAA